MLALTGYKDPASPKCSNGTELGCGIYHSSELKFVFQRASDPRGKAVAAAFGGYWTNMAKTGSPNGVGLVKWPSYAAEAGYQHAIFGDSVTIVSDSYRNVTCNFWDSMPKESPYA